VRASLTRIAHGARRKDLIRCLRSGYARAGQISGATNAKTRNQAPINRNAMMIRAELIVP